MTGSTRIPRKTSQASRSGAASADLPLATLLSQALVAFTIELDNEFEHRMPHRTTRHGAKGGESQGPWLVSLAMWANCMQFVGDEGVTIRELIALARTRTNFRGMVRWGYIVIERNPAKLRTKSPRSEWVIRATPQGRKAREVWKPLFAEIEARWQARFGEGEIHKLRESLRAVVKKLDGELDVELPGCLPILQYGLFSRLSSRKRSSSSERVREVAAELSLPLSALLSRLLLAIAIEYERESELSLAVSANVVRILDEKGISVRQLPLLSGVSKEAVSMALGFLKKLRYIEVVPDSAAGRGKLVRLTAKGRKAQQEHTSSLRGIEDRWKDRFGEDTVSSLRESLERLVGDGTAQQSPLFLGLEPHPEGWRASVRKPLTLPHFPMVSHRGGFPDGS